VLELSIGLVMSIAAALAIACAGYLSSAAMCQMTAGGLSHAVSDLSLYFKKSEAALDEYARERRARQLVVVMSSSGVVALVNIINAAVVAWALLQNGASINVVWWALSISLMSAFQLESCMRMRGRSIDVDNAPAILTRIIRNVGVFGLFWGAAAVLFVGDTSSVASIIVILALLGTAAGGLALLASLPPAALAFIAALGGPVFYKFLMSGEGAAIYLAVFTCVYIFTLGAITAGVYGAVIKRPSLTALGRNQDCSGVSCTDFRGRRIA
jgi:fumarate reductase subunit C